MRGAASGLARLGLQAIQALTAMGLLVGTMSAAHADVVQVHMKDLLFSPSKLSARVGDTVEWINDDFVAHTATARNGDWDVNIPAHATKRLVLKRAGTVDYYCRYHPNMKGTADIKE